MKRYALRDAAGLVLHYMSRRDHAIRESRARPGSSVSDERTGTTIHVTAPSLPPLGEAPARAEGWWFDSPELAVRDENGLEVARVHSEEDGYLIAAAPKLLEALRFIVNDATPGEDARLSVEGYNRACAAIEAARGEVGP